MTTTEPRAAGRREERDGRPTLVLERAFRAPVSDVWAAVTEPERLVRWIGTWSGDPASGVVSFRMTAQGESTTLTLAQRLHDPALATDVGPGWEYYLDRLAAAHAGGDVAAVTWPDHEGMSRYYAPLFTDPS